MTFSEALTVQPAEVWCAASMNHTQEWATIAALSTERLCEMYDYIQTSSYEGPVAIAAQNLLSLIDNELRYRKPEDWAEWQNAGTSPSEFFAMGAPRIIPGVR